MVGPDEVGTCNTIEIDDCLSVLDAKCETHFHDNIGQGQGHCRKPGVVDDNVVKFAQNNCFDFDCEIVDDVLCDDFSNENDFPNVEVDEDCSPVEDVGLPVFSGATLRQCAVRLFVGNNGGCESEIILARDSDWDNVPEYVGVTRNVSVCNQLAELYCVPTPVACVEIVPGSCIPVFNECLEGNCHCQYILQGVTTQLRPCQFAGYILCFDTVTKEDWYVLTGVCRGFRILDKGCTSVYMCENYSTITGEFRDEMTQKIRSELTEGKIRRVHSKPRCVHSLGGVVKTDGSLRPITDCSSPDDVNINLFMDNSCSKFHYHMVDDVITTLDPLDYCAVSDIKGAYRSVNVLPSHRDYQGFQWDLGDGNVYFNDLCICFGLRSAPFIFTQLSNFCVKCVQHEGVCHCVNYLDDFIVSGHSEAQCSAAQDKLHQVLSHLGFVIAEKKVITPSQEVKYLGIIINTLDMTLSVGEDKRQRVHDQVSELINKRWCSRKTLDQVAGLLAHCATVVKGGRTFSRRIYNLLRDTDTRCRRIRLTDLVMQDLKWWSTFLISFNGKAKIFKEDCRVVTIYTDASSTGFGGYSIDDFFWGFWTSEETMCPHQAKPPRQVVYDDNINIGELWPVVTALQRQCQNWKNCIVEIVTDNTQVYHALRTGRGINRVTMEWLRELFWISAFYNIHVRSSWIRGVDNILADSLSRLKNPDCIEVCSDRIIDFAVCCRSGLLKERMGPCEVPLLG